MNRTLLRAAILVLGLATALIHFSLLIGFFDIPFLLNGIGYIVLLAALFLPIPILARNRRPIHWIFMAYTLVTILAWVGAGERSFRGYADKAIEVLLIVALWLHLQSTKGQKSE